MRLPLFWLLVSLLTISFQLESNKIANKLIKFDTVRKLKVVFLFFFQLFFVVSVILYFGTSLVFCFEGKLEKYEEENFEDQKLKISKNETSTTDLDHEEGKEG
jgi:hypothetical protein